MITNMRTIDDGDNEVGITDDGYDDGDHDEVCDDDNDDDDDHDHDHDHDDEAEKKE